MSLHTLQFRCVLQVWTWQSLFFSLNPTRNKGRISSGLDRLGGNWSILLKRDGSTTYPNITCMCAVHQERLFHFMSSVIVFTFNDFLCVKLPSLDRGENSRLNNQWCVFPAWDCKEEERDHPTNYIPAGIFQWAFPGDVGDQEEVPGAFISSCAKICCSGDFSEGCTFILKCHFYSSHQLCFYLLFNL